MTIADMELSLVRLLRSSEFLVQTPQVAVMSQVEYTLEQMAQALVSVSAGIIVEPEDYTALNPNVPGSSGRMSWTIRCVLNPVSSMSGHLHPMDIALQAYLTLHLVVPKNQDGTLQSGGQWTCSSIKADNAELANGATVRTAVFTASAAFSTSRNARP